MSRKVKDTVQYSLAPSKLLRSAKALTALPRPALAWPALPCLTLCTHAAANGEVRVIIRPLVTQQLSEIDFPDSSESDTSSESDVAEITNISEMREIISRMDDDDDGDHDKCVPFFLLQVDAGAVMHPSGMHVNCRLATFRARHSHSRSPASWPMRSAVGFCGISQE